jgi:hypothetical protein
MTVATWVQSANQNQLWGNYAASLDNALAVLYGIAGDFAPHEARTIITGYGSGTGGAGTYTVNLPQAVGSSGSPVTLTLGNTGAAVVSGFISGNTLTVVSVTGGAVLVGQYVTGSTTIAPNMTMMVDQGQILDSGALVTNAAQTTGTFTAPASGYQRIDRVVVDQRTGVISTVTGTPATSNPSAPAIPAGKLPCAQVLLSGTTTAISNSLITDERLQSSCSKAYADATYAPLASPALTGAPTAPTAATGTNTTQLATTAFVLANAVSVPVRQTVLQSPVDGGGLPTFLPATSAGLTLATQNISTGANALVVTAAQGAGLNGAVNVVGQATSNLSWTCAASNTNFLPVLVNANGTLSAQTPATLAPIYQWGGTPSTASGQYTFNIQQMTMYLGNGAAANPVNHVIVGECVAGASTITSASAYALMGRYDSGFASTLPSGASFTSKNHNLGCEPGLYVPCAVLKCLTAEAGYAIGDVLVGSTSYNSASINALVFDSYRNSSGFTLAAGWYVINKGANAFSALTAANWAYKVVVNRGW